MEQLFKQYAPDVEVFPKEGSGLPPEMAKNIPALSPFPSATRPESDAQLDEDLDVLGRVKHEDENNLADHFGQMAIDAEGHHQCVPCTYLHPQNAIHLHLPFQLDRGFFNHDANRDFPE